jgi:zinc transport system permease protein
MVQDMFELFRFEFFRNAVAVSLLASVLCGIVGSIVVVRRMVILAGGAAHAAYGGVGLALYFGAPPQAGALAFSALLALPMGRLLQKHAKRADAVIGMIWAFGMAVGIVCTDLTPGYGADLMSYLFGSILLISRTDVVCMGIMVLAALLFVGLNYRGLCAFLYDEDFARLRGVRVNFLHYLTALLTCLAVVMLIRMVGLVLVMALLTVPAHLGEMFSRSLAGMMTLAACFSALFSLLGLWLSVSFNLTAGASIILVAVACRLAAYLLRREEGEA